MSEAGKRIDLRYGEFAMSVQGFENPVPPIKQVLRFMQRLVEETPEIADVGFVLDEDRVAEILADTSRRLKLEPEALDAVPGLIISVRADGDERAQAPQAEPAEPAAPAAPLSPAAAMAAAALAGAGAAAAVPERAGEDAPSGEAEEPASDEHSAPDVRAEAAVEDPARDAEAVPAEPEPEELPDAEPDQGPLEMAADPQPAVGPQDDASMAGLGAEPEPGASADPEPELEVAVAPQVEILPDDPAVPDAGPETATDAGLDTGPDIGPETPPETVVDDEAGPRGLQAAMQSPLSFLRGQMDTPGEPSEPVADDAPMPMSGEVLPPDAGEEFETAAHAPVAAETAEPLDEATPLETAAEEIVAAPPFGGEEQADIENEAAPPTPGELFGGDDIAPGAPVNVFGSPDAPVPELEDVPEPEAEVQPPEPDPAPEPALGPDIAAEPAPINLFASPDPAPSAPPSAPAPSAPARSAPSPSAPPPVPPAPQPPAAENIFGAPEDPPRPEPVPEPTPVQASGPVNIFGGPAAPPKGPPWIEDPNEPGPAPAAEPPAPVAEPPAAEPPAAASSRFEALVSRIRQPKEAEPSAPPPSGDGPGLAGPPPGVVIDPAELADRAGASSVPELLTAAAAWLTLVDRRASFGRREVMEIFDQLPGDHPRTLEARIKGYGKLVRNGALVLVDDGKFALSQEERTRFRSLLG